MAAPIESSYRLILHLLAQPAPAVKKKVSSVLESFISKINNKQDAPVSNPVATLEAKPPEQTTSPDFTPKLK